MCEFGSEGLCDVKSRVPPEGCVHTNRVESSPTQSSQTLESLGVHTDRVESNQVCRSSSGFLILFEQCKLNPKAMENFNMLVLHAIMWRRR